jgi:hypothetical protein
MKCRGETLHIHHAPAELELLNPVGNNTSIITHQVT